MKGDFSRIPFDKTKRFNRVLMQQGRVQLDADWNEQSAILQHYLHTLVTDLIGPYAGPQAACGFGILADAKAIDALPLTNEQKAVLKKLLPDAGLLIGPGRYYVEGLLCENDAYVGYASQGGYPWSESMPLADVKNPQAPFLVCLDVWERHITYVEDDAIREVALGGPDTATRVVNLWQIKAPILDRDAEARLTELTDGLAEAIRGGNANTIATARQNLRTYAEQLAQRLPRLSNATMSAQLSQEKPSSNPCITDPTSAYRGAENQLYRVEIHTGGDESTATFKWSRENGAVVTPLLSIDGDNLIVGSTRGFSADGWVEVTDDALELRGVPGALFRLSKVDGDLLTLVRTATSPGLTLAPAAQHPKVRRWDQRATERTALVNGAVAVRSDGPLELEQGIQIQFGANGSYRSGDYWLIPARVATGGIEWPQGSGPDRKALALPPFGIEHHYAPLAVVAVSPDGVAQAIDQRCKINENAHLLHL
jgi:hypothetical protein